MRGNPFAAVLAAVLVLAPCLAMAGEWKDGQAIVTPYGQPAAGSDGAAYRVWKMDPNGIGRVTEEYPITSQRVSYTAASGVSVHTGLKAIGNGYLLSPYGQRVLHVQSTRASGGTVALSYLYIYFSDDNVTYKPLLAPMGTSAAPLGISAIAALQDTAKTDTVMIALPQSPAAYDAYYTIPADIPASAYIQIWARRDSATAAVTTQTLTLTWLLREQ